ncbi:hypothetical protein ACLOAU_14745 [Niabella sp. CJ426]|uniref:hypothetical protein n=1 Tax=Niabella sp. CJ426 TaxID=3393740 RepID=UPI003CFF6DA7
MILETISDLRLTPGTVANRYAKVLGYHTPGDEGGGDFYWDSSSTETDNGGTVFESPGHPGRWTRGITSELNVHWFGAKGDGSTDDTAAIQACIDASIGVSDNVTYPLISFAAKSYCISNTITVSIPYCNIDFGKAMIIPHYSVGGIPTSEDFWAFDFDYLWVGGFERLRIKGFKNALRLYNNNIDTGTIKIDDLVIMNCENIEVNLRSSQCTISNFRIVDSQNIYIKQCDKIHFLNGWVNCAIFSKKYSGLFVTDYSSIVTFENIIFTPQAQSFTSTELFYIKNIGASIINILNCQFGGEAGQIVLVGNFTKSSQGRGVNINIVNTQAFCSGSPWVMLFNMPNNVLINNGTGTVDATHNYSMVHYVSDAEVSDYNSLWPVLTLLPPVRPNDPNPSQPQAVTYEDMISDLVTTGYWPPAIRIINTGPTGEIFTSTQRDMFRFLVGPSGERFSFYELTSEELAKPLLFDSIHNSSDAWQAQQNRAFKISLVTYSYSGPGRTSEYIVSFMDTKTAILESRHVGASTVTPLLFLDGNVVKLCLAANIPGLVYAKVEILACNADALQG